MKQRQKEKLKERVELLDANEHEQIFNIIKKFTDNYTKTLNGVLVSSDALPDECLVEIERMTTFYMDQRKQMDADALERKSYEKR